MTDDNKQGIIEKLDFFLEKKLKIHITKTNREFLNGNIISRENNGVYIIDEDNKGKIFIFASEVFDVEQFKEKETSE